MTSARLLSALLASAILSLVSVVPAESQDFDGITIIEIADQDGPRLIAGTPGAAGPYIVTYVAQAGTYASLGDGRQRACVAWARDGSYSGSSITFGASPTEQTSRLITPHICRPFKLDMSTPGTVRVQVGNAYRQRHRVLARIPLVAMDWGRALYARYAVRGVRLGPLPAVQAALPEEAVARLSPLERSYRGIRKPFSVSISPGDPQDSRTVTGLAAAAEVTGWPWDVLIAARSVRLLPQRSSVADLEAAFADRYGTASLSDAAPPTSHRLHYWLVDLSGRKLDGPVRGAGDCLATKPLWEREASLVNLNGDIGPWNCALVLRLRDHRDSRGWVRKYELEAISGYAAGLNHFFRRLEEIGTAREKLEAVSSAAVKP